MSSGSQAAKLASLTATQRGTPGQPLSTPGPQISAHSMKIKCPINKCWWGKPDFRQVNTGLHARSSEHSPTAGDVNTPTPTELCPPPQPRGPLASPLLNRLCKAPGKTQQGLHLKTKLSYSIYHPLSWEHVLCTFTLLNGL